MDKTLRIHSLSVRPMCNIAFKPFLGFSSLSSAALQASHPCTDFAKRAGYASWTAALEAMKSGKILVGTLPHSYKSSIGTKMFTDQLERDGLMLVPVQNCDTGFVWVGFREHFQKSTLARIESEAKKVLALFGGKYKRLTEEV